MAHRPSVRAVIAGAVALAGLGALGGGVLGAPASQAPPPPPPLPRVTGIGEPSIIVVTAGTYLTEAEAVAAAEAMSFGDLQGFYVDRTDHYRVLGSYRQTSPDFARVQDAEGRTLRRLLPVDLVYAGEAGPDFGLPPGQWFLLSAFRTTRGAEEFLDLARAATGRTDLVTLRVQKLAGPYVGLGQEPHPDGSGPLLEPLPNPLEYQR
jgi:hypothetical protein